MRSLSNVIKAYTVRYDKAQKTIDGQLRFDNEINQNRRIRIAANAGQHTDNGDFTLGIQAIAVEEVPSPEEDQKSTDIIKEAKLAAEKILQEARQEVQELKEDAFLKAQEKGYEEGLKKAGTQTQKTVAELAAKEERLRKEYEACMNELEPKMVEIISDLVQKLTGIVTTDRKDVIGYLVSSSLRDMDKCGEYTIRVSREDYDYMMDQKDRLLSAIDREAELKIKADDDLKKNQCLIETEQKIIDCSLDVQQNNLITDLKMLGLR